MLDFAPAIRIPAKVVPSVFADMARPADVQRAAAEYARRGPFMGYVGVDDALLARQLVHEAVSQLPPAKIHVNRRFDAAIAILKDGGRMPTMFDLPESARPPEYATRVAAERTFDMHGVGEDAGRSTYGSVQFADAFTGEEATRSRVRMNTGVVDAYGPVSFVLKPRVWSRATILPGDSYKLGPEFHRSGAVENLADVAASWLAHRGRVRGDAQHLKDALTGASTTENFSMIEAAIRGGATRDDIAEIRVARLLWPGEVDPDALRATDRQIRALRYYAGKVGIPVHQQTVYV